MSARFVRVSLEATTIIRAMGPILGALSQLGYHEILEQIDEGQLVLVTGEQDNAYQL